MVWQDDLLRGEGALGNGGVAPAARVLDEFERNLWLDVSRAPVLDAAEEQRIECRWYGPVQALAVPGLPRTPLFNRVLGAAEPEAAPEGMLGEALDWMEGKGVDFRVPLTPGRPGVPATEELLAERGYVRREGLGRFLRDPHPPRPAVSPGIEVIEVSEFTEGFSDHLCALPGLEALSACFIDMLPGRELWRCYVAIEESGWPIASAAMMIYREIAQLCFAATKGRARARGAHRALLERRIADAVARRDCRLLLAEAPAPLDPDAAPHAGARNLLRAGFRPLPTRPVWGPPPEALEEDEEDELHWGRLVGEEYGGGDEDEDDEDGGDRYSSLLS